MKAIQRVGEVIQFYFYMLVFGDGASSISNYFFIFYFGWKNKLFFFGLDVAIMKRLFMYNGQRLAQIEYLHPYIYGAPSNLIQMWDYNTLLHVLGFFLPFTNVVIGIRGLFSSSKLTWIFLCLNSAHLTSSLSRANKYSICFEFESKCKLAWYFVFNFFHIIHVKILFIIKIFQLNIIMKERQFNRT